MNIFVTFLTIASAVWLVLWLLGIAASFVMWCKLTPLQQSFAKVEMNPVGVIAAVASIIWLVSRAMS